MPHLGEMEALAHDGSSSLHMGNPQCSKFHDATSWKTQPHNDHDVMPLISLPYNPPKTPSMGLKELDDPSLS